jgi:hypothetical protein
MAIDAGGAVVVSQAANGFLVKPALEDGFVPDREVLVFPDEVGLTKWMLEHFAPTAAESPRRWRERTWIPEDLLGQSMGGSNGQPKG